MSNLSGYDSEAVGFDSVTRNKRSESSSSTQTLECYEHGVGTQTNATKDCGCMTTSEDLDATNNATKEFSQTGLNEFLRRVVPTMMDQLASNDGDFLYYSSESDEEDAISAKLIQEITVKTDTPATGAGDQQAFSILALSWSVAGNTLAVSIGKTQHEVWCEHDGLIKIYTLKRSEGDKFIHTLDLTEKNCVTALKFHPGIPAILAYGTLSGEVVSCNLQDPTGEGTQLASPSGCHGSKRVSCLHWADEVLANTFLIKQIIKTGKRRHASDRVLISSGSDGSVNVWQVNATTKVFMNMVTFDINGSRKMAAPDISCFDFITTFPLRPSDEKTPDDVFVVGTKCGKLFLCKTKNCVPISDSDMLDPVYEMLEGHGTCVSNVAFSKHKPGLFISISIDSELRLYDILQPTPLKVYFLDVPISCMCWLPQNPCIVIGLASAKKEMVRLFNVSNGRTVNVEGLNGNGESVTSVDVCHNGLCRIAAGDSNSSVRIWEVPLRRIKVTPGGIEF